MNLLCLTFLVFFSFVVAPPDFMAGLRRICDEHGIVLVVDEVQTGFGRTGRMFAIEHYDVEPDLITVAKSIAAGLPLSGVLGRAEIMDAPGDSAIGGTYVGNPVAQAAALAVLDVFEDSMDEGAAIIQWEDKSEGNDNQRWAWEGEGKDRRLKSKSSGLVLDVDSDGKVIQKKADEKAKSQLWQLVEIKE